MSTIFARTAGAWWRVCPDGHAFRIMTDATTTAGLIDDREAWARTATGEPVPVSGLTLVSPVTAPCRVVTQLVNYASHARDLRMDPKAVPPIFARQTSASPPGRGDPSSVLNT